MNRVTDVYIDGVVEYLKAAEKNVVDTKDPWVLCPCCECKNIKSFTSTTQIQTHLIKRGFVEGYECWSHHGEEEQSTDEEGADAYEEQISAGDAVMHDVEITTILPSHEVRQTNQVDITSSQGNNTTYDQHDSMSQMFQEFKKNCEDQKMYDEYVCMIENSKKPIYHECKPHYKKLAIVLELLQMKQKFG